ncbi:MAG: NarK/NasA family nitrate transporter [Pirellulales bacterium]|nr:NarK/NasA family nitrate transporter [Pirellulales bacterium]
MEPTIQSTAAPTAASTERHESAREAANAPSPDSTRQLVLATGAFACCFAVFGSASAMMPMLRQQLGLDSVQVSVALALPVLLGSLGRIPLGILTDRYGGRQVFLAVMAMAIVPAVLMGWVTEYWQLLACGFFLGIGLASFAVGVGFVSGWFPPQQQGRALGIYGAGNIGQSLAAFGAPLIAGALGFAWGFWLFALLTLVWAAFFAAAARNAPLRGAAKTWADFAAPLRHPMSWILSLYYFLTFGGFVAMAIYLPIFLTEMFHLTPRDAGLRTAGFVVLATAMRPLGGMLADRVGGQRILQYVFPVTAAMAICMAYPMISSFTVGALGMAAAIGLGNGAVFKLVPDHFPKAVGSVTGLVGAAGGLGGFFPPLALGSIHRTTGSFTGGFLLLSAFSVLCWAICSFNGRKKRVVSLDSLA